MINSGYHFLKLIYQQKDLIFQMAKREIKSQYIGSALGFVWTFIHPLMLIFVFWVVFSIGFRVQPTNNVPFVVWLTAGMSVWLAFADIVNGSTVIVVSHGNLIKKTLFQAQILPLVKIFAAMAAHGAFLVILIGLILFQNMPFSLFYFQFLYYLLCMLVLAVGISWAVAALNVFIRDVGQVIGVLLQIGFWATPIFWDIHIMPDKWQMIFKLNPMFYVVQGYRESFIYFVPFWEHPYQTIYFWVTALTALLSGAMIFKRLKPHFGDVL